MEIGLSKVPSEHDEQVVLVRRLRREGTFIFAVPSGGLRDAITGKRLKEEGVLPGIPDLCIILPDGRVLWVEMKRREGGVISKAQKIVHERFRDMAHEVIVAKGAKDAYEQIYRRLPPLPGDGPLLERWERN